MTLSREEQHSPAYVEPLLTLAKVWAANPFQRCPAANQTGRQRFQHRLTLACAEEIDRIGARGARDKIALIKVTVPEMTSRVVDRAVQVRCLSVSVYSSLVSFFLRIVNSTFSIISLKDLWWCWSKW